MAASDNSREDSPPIVIDSPDSRSDSDSPQFAVQVGLLHIRDSLVTLSFRKGSGRSTLTHVTTPVKNGVQEALELLRLRIRNMIEPDNGILTHISYHAVDPYTNSFSTGQRPYQAEAKAWTTNTWPGTIFICENSLFFLRLELVAKQLCAALNAEPHQIIPVLTSMWLNDLAQVRSHFQTLRSPIQCILPPKEEDDARTPFFDTIWIHAYVFSISGNLPSFTFLKSYISHVLEPNEMRAWIHTEPSTCLWTIISHVRASLHGRRESPRAGTGSCPKCQSAMELIRPLAEKPGYFPTADSCAFCLDQHDVRKCPIIRRYFPLPCPDKSQAAIRRLQNIGIYDFITPAYCAHGCGIQTPSDGDMTALHSCPDRAKSRHRTRHKNLPGTVGGPIKRTNNPRKDSPKSAQGPSPAPSSVSSSPSTNSPADSKSHSKANSIATTQPPLAQPDGPADGPSRRHKAIKIASPPPIGQKEGEIAAPSVNRTPTEGESATQCTRSRTQSPKPAGSSNTQQTAHATSSETPLDNKRRRVQRSLITAPDPNTEQITLSPPLSPTRNEGKRSDVTQSPVIKLTEALNTLPGPSQNGANRKPDIPDIVKGPELIVIDPPEPTPFAGNRSPASHQSSTDSNALVLLESNPFDDTEDKQEVPLIKVGTAGKDTPSAEAGATNAEFPDPHINSAGQQQQYAPDKEFHYHASDLDIAVDPALVDMSNKEAVIRGGSAPLQHPGFCISTSLAGLKVDFLVDEGQNFNTITRKQINHLRHYLSEGEFEANVQLFTRKNRPPSTSILAHPFFFQRDCALITIQAGPIGRATLPFFVTDEDWIGGNALGRNTMTCWDAALAECTPECRCGSRWHLGLVRITNGIPTYRVIPAFEESFADLKPARTSKPDEILMRAGNRPPPSPELWAPLHVGSTEFPAAPNHHPSVWERKQFQSLNGPPQHFHVPLTSEPAHNDAHINENGATLTPDDDTPLPPCPIIADRAFVPLTTRPGGQGATLRILYDSGAQASLLGMADYRTLRKSGADIKTIPSDGYSLTAANGSDIKHTHVINAVLYTPNACIRVPFFVCPDATTSILGMNAIAAFRLVLDMDTGTVETRSSAEVLSLSYGSPGDSAKEFRARTLRKYDIAAREGLTRVRMEVVDDNDTPVTGIRYVAVDNVVSTTIVKTDRRGRFFAPLSNMDHTPWEVKRHTHVASVENIDNFMYMTPQQVANRLKAEVPRHKHSPDDIANIRKLLEQTLKASTPYQYRDELLELLMGYEDVFSASRNDIGFCPLLQHSIHLSDDHPIFHPQFQIPAEHLAAIKDQTLAWEKAGIVRRGHSRCNNAIFAVPKPHGRGIRIVLDYRALNDATVPDRYSIPSVDEVLNKIGTSGARWFSSIDLSSGFYHIPLRESDQHLTAYTLPGVGQFMWRRASMGLTGSPATFNRVIDMILNDVEQVVNYVDDILCFTKDIQSHYSKLRQVLDRLRKAGLRVNAEKSVFLTTEVDYLGASVSQHGARPTLDKCKAVEDLKPPDTRKKLYSVLGFFNYCSRYIFHYTAKVEPLQKLLRGKLYSGGPIPPDALKAFNRIRDELAARPKVGYIRGDRDLHLYVDAALGGSRNYGKGFGAVLLQETPNDVPQPVCFLSRALQDSEENYPAGLAELQAIKWAVHKLAPYLKHRQFFLYSDHRPLTDKMLRGRQAKTYAHTKTELEDFMPIWRPVKGTSNVIADFLSRYHGMDSHVAPEDNTDETNKRIQTSCALVTHRAVNLLTTDRSHPRLKWLQQVDPETSGMMREIGPLVEGSTPADTIVATSEHCPYPLTIWNGTLMVKPSRQFNLFEKDKLRWLIYAPWGMRTELVNRAHGGHILAAHGGHKMTTTLVARTFWWPGMSRDCKDVVDNCLICKEATTKGKAKPTPRRPIVTPEHPNEVIQMDLHGPVHTHNNNNAYILIIVDALTKHLVLRLLPNKKAKSVAKEFSAFMMEYGTPKEVLTDNGLEFCNSLIRELCRRVNVKHNKTTVYFPQCNGLAEQINKTIQNYMRRAVVASQREVRDIADLLLPIQYTYNTSIHTSIRLSPHDAHFGYPARSPQWDDYEEVFRGPTDPRLSPIDRHLRNLEEARRIVRQNSEDAKEADRIRHNEDTDAEPSNYLPRQPVFIRRHVTGPINPKFHPRNKTAWIIRQICPDVYLTWDPNAGHGNRGALVRLNASHIKPAPEDTEWLDIGRYHELAQRQPPNPSSLPPSQSQESHPGDDGDLLPRESPRQVYDRSHGTPQPTGSRNPDPSPPRPAPSPPSSNPDLGFQASDLPLFTQPSAPTSVHHSERSRSPHTSIRPHSPPPDDNNTQPPQQPERPHKRQRRSRDSTSSDSSNSSKSSTSGHDTRQRRIFDRLPARPHIPPHRLFRLDEPVPNQSDIQDDPLLEELTPPPPLGTAKVPKKRGRRPYDEINRRKTRPGRPRKHIQALNVELRQRNLALRLKALLQTENGQERLLRELAAGKFALYPDPTGRGRPPEQSEEDELPDPELIEQTMEEDQADSTHPQEAISPPESTSDRVATPPPQPETSQTQDPVPSTAPESHTSSARALSDISSSHSVAPSLHTSLRQMRQHDEAIMNQHRQSERLIRERNTRILQELHRAEQQTSKRLHRIPFRTRLQKWRGKMFWRKLRKPLSVAT